MLAIAAVGYVLWSRMKGQPLKAKRLLVLPVVLTVLGITDLTGSSAPHLTPKDIGFLVASVVISAVLGAARGATIELYPHQGELWQRYRPNTVGLWVALIVTKVVLVGAAGAAHASAGGGTNSLLVSLGASLLAEAAVVGPGLSTGLPFAAKGKDRDANRPGRSQPSPAETPVYTPLPPGRPSSSWPDEGALQPAPTSNDGGQWRSPSLRDGAHWLRRQLGQPGGPMGSYAPRPNHRQGLRDDHGHHHQRRSDPS